jgi:hypothetical protein
MSPKIDFSRFQKSISKIKIKTRKKEERKKEGGRKGTRGMKRKLKGSEKKMKRSPFYIPYRVCHKKN